jgi:hypothetical protein
MNNATAKTKAIPAAREELRLDTELSKVGIATMGFIGISIGLWAVACMIGGLVASNGPLAFISSWFGAVVGG